jgi:hypothetical protein
MMYLPLMHEFMKLIEVMSRVVLFTFSKYGKIITPFIQRGDNIRKTRNSEKSHMLASEVTPGLLAGAEPDAHQFYVTICLMG